MGLACEPLCSRLYVGRTILALDKIYINGGRRGHLAGIAPQLLTVLLGARPVSCAIEE
ncbi:MAG: hypothetical protein V4508_08040 [Pseudomonadota bacterium]